MSRHTLLADLGRQLLGFQGGMKRIINNLLLRCADERQRRRSRRGLLPLLAKELDRSLLSGQEPNGAAQRHATRTSSSATQLTYASFMLFARQLSTRLLIAPSFAMPQTGRSAGRRGRAVAILIRSANCIHWLCVRLEWCGEASSLRRLVR